MTLYLKLFLLIALIRLGIQYDPFQERPWLLALVYALGSGFVNLSFGAGWLLGFGLMIGSFLVGWLYFALLTWLAEAGPFWWLICLVGLPLIAL